MAIKLTYEQWMKQVNDALYKKCGMGADMLPDWNYRDDYTDGVSPTSCAAHAIRNAKEG